MGEKLAAVLKNSFALMTPMGHMGMMRLNFEVICFLPYPCKDGDLIKG
jgi:hypothetical protein